MIYDGRVITIDGVENLIENNKKKIRSINFKDIVRHF